MPFPLAWVSQTGLGERPSAGYMTGVSIDARTHKRYLDYRERLVYFIKEGRKSLSYEQFVAAEDERRELEAKGDTRDEEEEARFVELAKCLLCD